MAAIAHFGPQDRRLLLAPSASELAWQNASCHNEAQGVSLSFERLETDRFALYFHPVPTHADSHALDT